MINLTMLTNISFWRKLRRQLDWESKLRNKLFFMVLLLSCIPFIFFTYFAIQKTSDYIYLESKQETIYIANRLKYFIDYHFRSYFVYIHDLFKDNLREKGKALSQSNQANTILQHGFNAPNILAFRLQNQDTNQSTIETTAGSHDTFPSFTQWQPLNHKGYDFSIVSPYFDSSFNKTILPLTFTFISLQGHHYRATVIMSIDRFKSDLLDWQFGDDSRLTIASVDGHVIFPLTFPPNPLLDHEKAAIHKQPDQFQSQLYRNEQGHNTYLIHTQSEYLGWSIFIERHTNIASALVNRLQLILVIFVIAAVLVAILASVFIVYKIVVPIEDLESGIKLLENGLFTEALPIRAKDEIARLTLSFNQMAQTLTQREEEIKNQNKKLSFFNDITTTINQTINLHDNLAGPLQNIIQYLQASVGWIYSFDSQNNSLQCKVYQGLFTAPPATLTIRENDHHPIVSVFQSGTTKLMRDAKVINRQLSDIIHVTNQNVVLVPLRSQSKVLGVLGLASRMQKRFRFNDTSVLNKIGNELGLAIENAQLYTELHFKINELEAVNKDLQDLDHLKNRILSNVSHELRTPITSIRSYVELFLSNKIGQLDELQKDKLLIIKRNINHLLTLIEDLLTLARIQDQKMALKNLEVTECRHLIDEVIASTEMMATSKGLVINKSVPNYPVMVRINRAKIIQVLQNLISNAIKFTSKGSISINLDVVPADDNDSTEPVRAVKLAITDTGIGIQKKQLPKIFRRFYQIDSSSTRKYVGTGLGLSIVKEILEAHNSQIHVESQVNHGSTFWFHLPMVNEIN